MQRVIVGLVLFSFFAATSAAVAGDGNDRAAGSDDSAKSKVAEGKTDAASSDLEELRGVVQSQSEELRDLRNRLAAVEAEAAAKKAPVRSSAPEGANQVSAPAVTAEVSTADISPSPITAGSTAAAQQGPGGNPNEAASPLSFKIGSAEFTPGGFLDFAAFYRSTNVGSGIATSFGSIPFNNQLPQGGLSETRFSAQYSRLSLKVDTHLTETTALTGYVETDFLGFQPANAYQTANSDSLRLRLYWADVRHGKWEFLGGQAWSLLTPNRVGLSSLPADVFTTLDEDPNFQVGLTWARQPQFRVVYHATTNWAVGLSLENPQQFAPGSVVFPSTFFTTQFDNGSGSTSAASSATNTAVPNRYPDIIVKTALDVHPAGRALHVEAAGMVRGFKVLNNLQSPATSNTITGGGGSLNANFELIRNLHLIANSFYSYGGGRYVFGLGPDVIVKPDGTLSGIHSGSGLAGFEYQAKPHYMFYGYYGGAYFQRNYGLLAGTPSSSCNGFAGFTCVGFGFPGSANTSNRAIQESTFGFIPTLWSNPNSGRLQIITQYSYLVRSPWSVPAPSPKNAHTNMLYLDIRYTLP